MKKKRKSQAKPYPHNPLWRKFTYFHEGFTNPNSPLAKTIKRKKLTTDFDNFRDFEEYILNTIGLPPTPRHRLGRKDQNLGWICGNLEWALPKQIQNNMPDYNIFLTYRRKTRPFMFWIEEYGVNKACAYSRYRAGWSVPEILGIKPRDHRKA